MVSLLILSHSPRIAEGTRELALEMGGEANIIAIGGTKDGFLGADFDATKQAMMDNAVNGDVIVLADMGSTRMTAQMAAEDLDPSLQARIHMSDAALVEGAVVAAVAVAGGLDVAAVLEQLQDFELEKG